MVVICGRGVRGRPQIPGNSRVIAAEGPSLGDR
jgi:hypothetical protein